MCHHLLLNYGLYRHLEVYRPSPATFDELARFHTQEYVQFLQQATPENLRQFSKHMLKCKLFSDILVFLRIKKVAKMLNSYSLIMIRL